jgi:hypothetical protein
MRLWRIITFERTISGQRKANPFPESSSKWMPACVCGTVIRSPIFSARAKPKPSLHWPRNCCSLTVDFYLTDTGSMLRQIIESPVREIGLLVSPNSRVSRTMVTKRHADVLAVRESLRCGSVSTSIASLFTTLFLTAYAASSHVNNSTIKEYTQIKDAFLKSAQTIQMKD